MHRPAHQNETLREERSALAPASDPARWVRPRPKLTCALIDGLGISLGRSRGRFARHRNFRSI